MDRGSTCLSHRNRIHIPSSKCKQRQIRKDSKVYHHGHRSRLRQVPINANHSRSHQVRVNANYSNSNSSNAISNNSRNSHNSHSSSSKGNNILRPYSLLDANSPIKPSTPTGQCKTTQHDNLRRHRKEPRKLSIRLNQPLTLELLRM